MGLTRFSFLATCLTCSVVFGQVPTIIHEIDQLESVRDPKCYATASRLEDFIYGRPLDFSARSEKIALQKEFIRDLWMKSAAAASAGGKTQIDTGTLGVSARRTGAVSRRRRPLLPDRERRLGAARPPARDG